MRVKSLSELDVREKRVLVRVDFNVPLIGGEVSDDTRIRAAMPTIEYLRGERARIVLMSHLGRPKGERKPEFSLAPVARHLGRLLGTPVPLAPDCIGEEVGCQVSALAPGSALLLENLRFHKEETDNTPEFCRALAALGDAYVNDAFGTAHRAHASTAGVAALMPQKAAGLLMERELRFLGEPVAAFGWSHDRRGHDVHLLARRRTWRRPLAGRGESHRDGARRARAGA
jgi:phosphoglycerate kinase